MKLSWPAIVLALGAGVLIVGALAFLIAIHQAPATVLIAPLTAILGAVALWVGHRLGHESGVNESPPWLPDVLALRPATMAPPSDVTAPPPVVVSMAPPSGTVDVLVSEAPDAR